jgi:hypothetical protein
MFGRNKKDNSRSANRLSDETEPNVLTGEGSERANTIPLEDPQTLYGPNGEAVAGLVGALDEIGSNQVQSVALAWASVRPADRQIAQMMARRLRSDRRLDAPLRAAESRIRDWLEAHEDADEREASLYEEVADAARDAVAALILDEELNDADFATLYGPWSDVMDVDTETGDSDPDEGDDDDEILPAAGEATEAEEAGADEQTNAERDFGPNATVILELLAQLENLSPDQARSLSSAWGSADPDALVRAHAALEGAIEADPDSRDEVERVQAAVAEWAGETDVQLREQAAPAVADAVAALAMVDALSDTDAATLYAPWAYAVGTPELPSLEDEEPS